MIGKGEREKSNAEKEIVKLNWFGVNSGGIISAYACVSVFECTKAEMYRMNLPLIGSWISNRFPYRLRCDDTHMKIEPTYRAVYGRLPLLLPRKEKKMRNDVFD